MSDIYDQLAEKANNVLVVAKASYSSDKERQIAVNNTMHHFLVVVNSVPLVEEDIPSIRKVMRESWSQLNHIGRGKPDVEADDYRHLIPPVAAMGFMRNLINRCLPFETKLDEQTWMDYARHYKRLIMREPDEHD